MKRYKLLLIALLIVGCDYAPTNHTHDADDHTHDSSEHTHDDEIKEVAWLWSHENANNAVANMYYTQGYTPVAIDTLNSNNELYIRYSMGTLPDIVDVLESKVDSVGSIFHLVAEDVFHVYGRPQSEYTWVLANIPSSLEKYEYK
tara:strand:- start:323 stop:757 length:435 start_codon:yes stop_codon:yes gene_type:complete